jgi:hypothetical protein
VLIVFFFEFQETLAMDPQKRLNSSEVLQHKYFVTNGWSEEYTQKLRNLVDAHNARVPVVKVPATPNGGAGAANLTGLATASTLTVQSTAANPTNVFLSIGKTELAPPPQQPAPNSRLSSSNKSNKGGKNSEPLDTSLNASQTMKKDTEATNAKSMKTLAVSKSVQNAYGQSTTPLFNNNSNFDDLIISNSILNNSSSNNDTTTTTTTTTLNNSTMNGNPVKMKLTFLNNNNELKPAAVATSLNNQTGSSTNDPNAKKNNKLVILNFLILLIFSRFLNFLKK